MSDTVKGKVEEYLAKAEPLFQGVEVTVPENPDLEKIAKEFEEMAFSYLSDAKHFFEDGNYVNSLAALEYAEGWLDAGKRLGVFKEK
ncbi:MAG: DUF357 domain-containing protein [Methanobacteriota archaeon]